MIMSMSMKVILTSIAIGVVSAAGAVSPSQAGTINPGQLNADEATTAIEVVKYERRKKVNVRDHRVKRKIRDHRVKRRVRVRVHR
jgi:hypothetical protein